jgi:hypothetical protein
VMMCVVEKKGQDERAASGITSEVDLCEVSIRRVSALEWTCTYTFGVT